MDSYIVRIYRRDKKDPARIVGLIETVETGEVKKFDGRDELWKVVCMKPGRRKKADRGNL